MLCLPDINNTTTIKTHNCYRYWTTLNSARPINTLPV